MRYLLCAPAGLSALSVLALVCACATQRDLAERLQPEAIKAAQEHGGSQFACPATTAEVLSQKTLEEPQGTGWYEPPRRAEYTVAIAGCGKRETYSVACDSRNDKCIASSPASAATTAVTLADKMQPLAIKSAEETGSSALGCPATTGRVVRQETIEEPQGTGWYEHPHRAVYTVSVSGCGKKTNYLVACDDRQKSACAAGSLQAASGAPRDLADDLEPGALKVAQQHGSSELDCQAATATVLRSETIQEPQGTGWYEPPYRAVYTISVSGCGKSTSYLVACDKKQKNCTAGHLQGTGR
jgi:hypothetical protein